MLAKSHVLWDVFFYFKEILFLILLIMQNAIDILLNTDIIKINKIKQRKNKNKTKTLTIKMQLIKGG